MHDAWPAPGQPRAVQVAPDLLSSVQFEPARRGDHRAAEFSPTPPPRRASNSDVCPIVFTHARGQVAGHVCHGVWHAMGR
eukprot:7979839-Pyramimonas_sp.AAC.1